ncbi:MAG TPA: hypothetical protein PLQ44_03515, partial [Candidatus Paceibacterota bacterium]|nr:hypothetical protein [Candidatus Paceibacterota bacterium]
LQTDPLGYQDSMNLYQGMNMNPVNFVDPKGEDVEIDGEVSEKQQEAIFRSLILFCRTPSGYRIFNTLNRDTRIFKITDLAEEEGGRYIIDGVNEDLKDFNSAIVVVGLKAIKGVDRRCGQPIFPKYIDYAIKSNTSLSNFERFKGFKSDDYSVAEVIGHEFAHAKESLINPEHSVKRHLSLTRFNQILKMNNFSYDLAKLKNKKAVIEYELFLDSVMKEEVEVSYPLEKVIHDELLDVVLDKDFVKKAVKAYRSLKNEVFKNGEFIRILKIIN